MLLCKHFKMKAISVFAACLVLFMVQIKASTIPDVTPTESVQRVTKRSYDTSSVASKPTITVHFTPNLATTKIDDGTTQNVETTSTKKVETTTELPKTNKTDQISTESKQISTEASTIAARTTFKDLISSTTFVRVTTRSDDPVTVSPSPKDVVVASADRGYPLRPSSRLDERLQALDCDIPLLPAESRLWRGNETHELMLPITIPEECGGIAGSEDDCLPVALSWEGAAEVQSGDILLVRIDDAQLILAHANANRTTRNDGDRMHHAPLTAVYQVTRQGHEHCDVTEGVLLDITPLLVDGKKLVTLYDKDLTEGVNLLIVVSETWGAQCVRLKVTVKSDNCGDNQDCSDKGVCYSNISMEGYECQCCPGFVGPHCEEQDACFPSPCTNNGICVDISQGHNGATYQCLCPYGYTGKHCQEEVDPCGSSPCQNGAACSGNVTQFRCECPRGFAGVLCQHALNECESSPCRNGICVDQEDGYRCYCTPGYAGQHCEYEYNECESSPCTNGGTCTDHVGSYTCMCGRGYTGKRCQIKVDLCSPNPCASHHYCTDRGNNYSCECPRGYAGPGCLMPAVATCNTNPCANGGTCWSSVDSYYCACRPGYTGKTCEDDFIVESVGPLSADSQDARDLRMPLSLYHDRLHNVYIAAGTLGAAIAIVGVVVTACHCRVNKTYQRWITRVWPGRRGTEAGPQHHWLSDKMAPGSGGQSNSYQATPAQHKALPPLDTADMYYTLDFGDSQSSPLIQ